MTKYIKQVENEQEQVTARDGEDSSLLAEGGLLSEMFSVADEQSMLDNITSAATPYFRATLDRLTRKNPSADVSRLERISYSLTIRTMRRRLDRHIKTLFVCARDCWNAIKQKGKRRIRRIVNVARRTIVSATGLFSASSAEAASRHRESDDAGGDDEEDSDPARVHHIQRQRVLAVLLEGRSINRFEAIDLGIHRLAARVCELKERGWQIQKETLPGRFASYFMADEDNPRPLARKEADR